MMDLATIRNMSRDAAATAAEEDRIPFAVEREDLEDWKATLAMGKLPKLPFPSIGDHVPAGFEIIEDGELFVDSSGLGSESDPAITIRSLIMDHIQPGFAYAITSIGQFQIYIGKFRKVKA